ncbi:MAG TPA: alpha/beta hydrolase family protein, partial [Prolixibacteraceae bacterium]|nr:alpha/beta hydrolase family protein [Prolixibacteraceae bacterium]
MKKKCIVSVLITFFLLGISPDFVFSADTLRTFKYTQRSYNEAIIWQNEIRSNLFQHLKLNDLLSEKKNIQFNPVEVLSEDKGKFILKEIEINTTPERRIKIVITIPAKMQKPAPAVVCIHGHGGKLYSVFDGSSIYKGFAGTLASVGYVTIACVVSQHDVYEQDRMLMGERLWDLMRCVDYLESLEEVDKTRIGCAGLSLGGEMAMWLGGMDIRIKATVSSGFLTKMDQLEKN